MHLRLVRLPLVAFFETSFSRVYDKTFILVTRDADGAARHPHEDGHPH